MTNGSASPGTSRKRGLLLRATGADVVPKRGRYSINAPREAFQQTLKAAGVERHDGNRQIRLCWIARRSPWTALYCIRQGMPLIVRVLTGNTLRSDA